MKRVLIVDDAAFMRNSIRIMAEKNGFRVVGEAEDGIEGVRLYMKLKPDIVTMDITMPTLTGVNALKAIKAFDPDANVVMISAMGQESLIKEAIMQGAKSFIVKPFKTEQVIETFKKVLSMK